MAIETEPFYKRQEGKKEDTFTVRMNPQERAWLQEIKEDLDIKSDGKALKMGAFIGRNVIQGTFTRAFLKYLFKKERSRFSEVE